MMFEDIEVPAKKTVDYDIVETLRTMSIYFGWAGEAANQIEKLQARLRTLENANKLALDEVYRLQARVIELEGRQTCC